MKAIIKKSVFLIALVCMSCLSCSKEDSNNDGDQDTDNLTFEEVIAKGGETESFPLSRTTEVIDESEPMNEDYDREDEDGETISERFICTTQTVSVLDGNGQFPLFDTSADVIYPGSLLQGATLSNATPSPIVVDRAGGTISYNLNNGNTSSSFTVDEVRKSTIQDGMNNIIANAGDVVPANFQLEIVQIESESQLALELGIEVETYTTQVSADMSFSTEQTFNRTLVKLNQSYYTMSFDLPTSLDDIFAPNVTPQQLDVYVQENNPATFISSVTYGRIFYMLIESTSSRQEMDAKLDIAYGAFNNSAEAELGVSAMEELNDLKIKVIAYGGDAAGSFQLAGETNISDIANKLAESTDIRAGLPLSYVVRSVERPDRIVGVELATEYDIVDCELKGILPPQGLLSLVDLFSNDEDGGGIGAMLHVSDSNLLVFNKMGTKYAWYNGNSGDVKAVFNIDDPDSPLGIVPLNDVGAAIQFSNTSIYLFDKTGLLSSLLSYNITNWSGNGDAPTSPIGTYTVDPSDSDNIFLVNSTFGDSGNFQFAGQGFEAGCRVGVQTHAYFAKPGEEYALYSTPAGGSWENPLDSTTWYDNLANTEGTLFDKVGAASFIEFGGSSGRWYLVNEAGDEIMEYLSTPVRTFNGPWVIN
ncbi:thiol-activated cytolysin family protein [Winogradskyella flava]|uniref:Thiol-activated cytolysin family protein n=1 Tax=Winogradskyella flava TaxID=1884876 RepID=A0A842IVS9_9FLAO|nr:thiol-activated cytolysin family protein [Winogradskyella flava]MBC2846054.1 thiol-activated cytolysin family protein [Winogradskyella flava]